MVAKEVDNSSSNSKIDEMKMARETKLKPRYHRHTPHQVKEMEAFFKDCPHPSDKQRRQLGRELGLEPTQVKFWFQNKHNQVKTQYQRIDNMQLRLMNESLRAENKMYKESLCSVACASCGGRFGTGEVSPEELQLRMENEALRKEIYRISTMARMHAGKPLSPA